MTTRKTTRTTKRDRLQIREQKILLAARAAFISHGYRGTSMREIAERADMAEGTLYLYFKNKNDIVRAVVDAHWQRITEDANAALEGKTGVFAQLEALASYHLDMMVRNWPLIELSYVLLYTEDKSVSGAMQLKRNYTASFDHVIERARDRGEIAKEPPTPFLRDLFFGTLEYAARTLVLHNLADKRDKVVGDLINVLRKTLQTGQRRLDTSRQDRLLKRFERIARRLERLG